MNSTTCAISITCIAICATDAFFYLHAYLFGFVFTAFFFYMHAVFITNLYWHADDTTNMVTDPVN